jgi:hypothetical protein
MEMGNPRHCFECGVVGQRFSLGDAQGAKLLSGFNRVVADATVDPRRTDPQDFAKGRTKWLLDFSAKKNSANMRSWSRQL